MVAPPRSPTNLTTSRNRALDVGTDRGGFPSSPPYDAAAGTPVGWPGSAGAYQHNVGQAVPPPAPAPPNPKPIK